MAEKLRAVEEAVAQVRATEEELEGKRAQLYEALRAAHQAGASAAFLARIVGLSRQRVARIVSGG